MKSLRTYLLFIFLSCSISLCIAQVDTLKLIQKVNSLTDLESHVLFWNEIDKSDQTHRGEIADEELDFNNLILVSYYLNKFGYPKRNLCGINSIVINPIWIHNKYPILKRLSFPIILQGFKANEIPEKDIRNYFLQTLYLMEYDDNDIKTKPLSVLFKSLKLNTSAKIDINTLCEAFDSCRKFELSPRELLGEWKENDVSKIYENEKNPIEMHFKGRAVQIFKSVNNQYFLYWNLKGRGHYPEELEPLNKEITKFKYKAKLSFKYFEIGKDSNLYFRDAEGNEIAKYDKIGM